VVNAVDSECFSVDGMCCSVFVASFLRSSTPRKLQRQASVFQRPHLSKQKTVYGTPPDDDEDYPEAFPFSEDSDQPQSPGKTIPLLNNRGFGAGHQARLEWLQCTKDVDVFITELSINKGPREGRTLIA
jgi:hypothetical protein